MVTLAAGMAVWQKMCKENKSCNECPMFDYCSADPAKYEAKAMSRVIEKWANHGTLPSYLDLEDDWSWGE